MSPPTSRSHQPNNGAVRPELSSSRNLYHLLCSLKCFSKLIDPLRWYVPSLQVQNFSYTRVKFPHNTECRFRVYSGREVTIEEVSERSFRDWLHLVRGDTRITKVHRTNTRSHPPLKRDLRLSDESTIFSTLRDPATHDLR